MARVLSILVAEELLEESDLPLDRASVDQEEEEREGNRKDPEPSRRGHTHPDEEAADIEGIPRMGVCDTLMIM